MVSSLVYRKFRIFYVATHCHQFSCNYIDQISQLGRVRRRVNAEDPGVVVRVIICGRVVHPVVPKCKQLDWGLLL